MNNRHRQWRARATHRHRNGLEGQNHLCPSSRQARTDPGGGTVKGARRGITRDARSAPLTVTRAAQDWSAGRLG